MINNSSSPSDRTSAQKDKGMALPLNIGLGKYKLIKKISQSGFGITYLAIHTDKLEQVVIKECLPTFCAYRNSHTFQVTPLDDDSINSYKHTLLRFIEEARTLAHLSHPNIVRVLEAFEALGTAYYVMPYIPGKEIHKATPADVTEEWLLPILHTLLNALNYLHSKNQLHRNITPDNILLQENGIPMLINIGTTSVLHSNDSATMIGTPGYTPVELINTHEKLGSWTDIYALGATCYRLITGEVPPSTIDRMNVKDPYIPLSTQTELTMRFSTHLLESIDKALAFHPSNRWQTDRTLPKLAEAYKIGLCFPFQFLESIPCEAFDIKMDAVLCDS